MTWLKDFINGFFASLWNLVKIVLGLLWDIVSLFFFWLLDGFLTVVTVFLSGINLSALGFQTFAEWSDMPPQLIYLVNELALPQCVTIIAGAIAVRKVIDLLPAAVTRV
jgi:hypothetical protein